MCACIMLPLLSLQHINKDIAAVSLSLLLCEGEDSRSSHESCCFYFESFTAILAIAVHAHKHMCMRCLGMQSCSAKRRTGYAGPIKDIECHSAIVQLVRKCRKLSFAV